MNNITMLDSNLYAIKPAHAGPSGKITNGNDIGKSNNDIAQEFSALAIQPGMITSLIHGQSLMVQLDTRPTLSAPPARQEKINAEQAQKLMKLTTAMDGSDINKLERAAASAATLFNTQPGLLQTLNQTNNANKSLQTSTSSLNSAIPAVSTKQVVEGGTDITSVDATGHQFINVMGDLKMMALNNQLIQTLTKQEAESAKSSAQSSLRTVEAANRAGNKGIEAEKQRMTGAITSGAAGIVGQGVTATRTMKALNNESKSINNNLSKAITIERKQGTHQAATTGAADNLLHKGQTLNESASGLIGAGVPLSTGLSGTARNQHNQVQIKTNHTRAGSDYGNTIVHSGQKMVEGGFNVSAAGETKEAEMARADQTVNNEIANTHQQTSRKAAETKSALNQFFENTLSNNNSAASSVADRMR
ncbi:type III secretion system protein [Citrobacter sp. JGM124]|uniref:type III secretion system protein n=1 Tax=Citrobacter sp. JGM124 TaxID=2799789 RepID=UPI001BACB5B4|nr:type III secretion system protein [Citrobacter sp. JGM124]MBS0846931.1 type III secretion system protein [Citrobacter sp. JGM124]